MVPLTVTARRAPNGFRARLFAIGRDTKVDEAPVSNYKLALTALLNVTGTMIHEPFISTGTIIVLRPKAPAGDGAACNV